MANSPSALKRARQADKRRLLNTAQRSRMRSEIKKVLRAVMANDKEAAQAAFKTAEPAIDRATTKGLIHRNAAARYKSRLIRRIKAIS